MKQTSHVSITLQHTSLDPSISHLILSQDNAKNKLPDSRYPPTSLAYIPSHPAWSFFMHDRGTAPVSWLATNQRT